ncbi:MAG: PEP-CTERM sorting domain-containing protein [Cyanobacteria bacterium J06592_8]
MMPILKTVLATVIATSSVVFSAVANAATFEIQASDAYYTFAGNVSSNSNLRLLTDKATAIGFDDLDTLSFLQFDAGDLPIEAIEGKEFKATLTLEYDSQLTELANLIPATPERPVSVSVYGLTAPFNSVEGNVNDINYGTNGENAIANATIGEDRIYTWNITALVEEWLDSSTSDTNLALSGVFGNVDLDGRNSYASFYTVGATEGLVPTVTIQVPEPSSLVALSLISVGLGFATRRRSS